MPPPPVPPAFGPDLDLTPPPSSAIVEPVPRGLLAALRRAVVDHARAEQRRAFPPVVHVGVPGAKVVSLGLGEQLGELRFDAALRVDALEAMVRRARGPGPPPVVWLTRPGTLEVRDVDRAWLCAARSAAAELGCRLPMVVVTRRSWADPGTGVHRTWATRLRGP